MPRSIDRLTANGSEHFLFFSVTCSISLTCRTPDLRVILGLHEASALSCLTAASIIFGFAFFDTRDFSGRSAGLQNETRRHAICEYWRHTSCHSRSQNWPAGRQRDGALCTFPKSLHQSIRSEASSRSWRCMRVPN